MLIFIAVPSLKTLYLLEDYSVSKLSVKVTGHQWHWSYQNDLGDEEPSYSFMENSNIIRLFKTSNVLRIPVNEVRRFLISSEDVIHSWAMPSMGVKIDAVPGRLNRAFILPKQIGIYFGQCSEICGTNHSFMPIIVQVKSLNKFIETLLN